MNRTLLLALPLALITAGAAFASGDYARIDDATRAKITEKLTGQGYEVRQIKSEDGMIEVYALKEGQRLELYLDADMNIVRSKRDD